MTLYTMRPKRDITMRGIGNDATRTVAESKLGERALSRLGAPRVMYADACG